MGELVYLDHAATTPLRDEVKVRLKEMIDGPFGNPSSTHQFGRKSRIIIESARKYIAQSLNCSTGEIIFTSGGTEADNAALLLPVQELGIKRIITSPTEHHAVLHTAEKIASKQGVSTSLLNINENGEPDLDQLNTLLADDEPTLVSIMHGNNEIGNLIDLHQVGEICHRHGALFHSDTVQTVGHYEFDLANTPVDFITASAHKFHGPKGVGFLYVNKNVKLSSLITGGTQERGHRGGTENIIGIAAMHTALEAANNNMETESAHIRNLKTSFLASLKSAFPSVEVNGLSGDLHRSLYTVLSLVFPMFENDTMFLFSLDLEGIAVSGGSACASGSNQGSHVIKAIKPGLDHPVVRFSFGKDNTEEQLNRVLEVLKKMMP